ncbi:hypothetical protein Syun_029263 [Stephania yunnanensis]|uniref:Uncharacterized protein n=1 Tax=Stephania yunnanensis TaxID=152371 RepID=A0AAP0E595_9MAGN
MALDTFLRRRSNSSYRRSVLDKLDAAVAVDNAIDELSTIIHRKVLILSLALMQWRLILDFLICTLTDWNCDEVKEKEIGVDTNCNERVELGAREALVDVQDESELIMIDSSHSEDTIEESSDITIKDKDVLREFDDDEEEINNEDKSILEMEKIKDFTKNAMRPPEDSIVEMFTNKWYT